MRQFILTCMVFLCMSHSAVSGYLTDKQIAGLIWHFVEKRCPEEAPKYLEQRPSSLESMGYFMVGGEFDPKIYQYNLAPWEIFAAWTNEFIHKVAFVAVGVNQVGNFINYLAYLEDGVVSKPGYDADGLRKVLVADNDLLKCLMPHEDEFSAIRGKQMGYIAGQLMCKSWIEATEGLLALDMALAGTPEMNERSREVLMNTIGQCDKDNKFYRFLE